MDICKAVTSKGKPCRRAASTKEGYCYWHGGQLVPSKFAETMAGDLTKRFNELFNDPDLLSMRHEIVLIDMRLEALLGQLGGEESGEAWRRLQGAMERYREAKVAKDGRLQAASLKEVDAIAMGQHGDTVRWNNIHAIIEQRRRLVETEQRSRLLNRGYIKYEVAWGVMQGLIMAVGKRVPDQKVLEEINEEFRVITAPFRTGPTE